MTRSSRHILVLSPTPTHPQDAGNRKRIFEVCDALRNLGGIIHFVYVPREWDRTFPQEHYKSMVRHWDYFHIVAPVQPAVHETTEDYFELDAWWDVGIEYLINWKKLSQKFDMVIANYVFYSKCLTLFSKETVKVLDTHDVMSGRQHMLDRHNIKREFFYTSEDREKVGLERADLILAIKDSEASHFSKLTDKPILVLGHKEPRRFIERGFYGARILGLIGSANSINRENFERFFAELNAKLPVDRPDFRIELAGHVCSMMDTRPYSFVKWLGPISDITEFYRRLDVSLLPFDFSTGLKIKTIEALSFGLPVIGTANAFDGLTSRVPEHQSATISEMVDIVIQNIMRPRVLNVLAAASRQTFDAYAETVDRAVGALYDLAGQDRIATAAPRRTVAVAGRDKGLIVFASRVAFWQPSTLSDLSISRLVEQLRYGRHIEYLYDGLLDDHAKSLLYRAGLVDHVHELGYDDQGSLVCPPWAVSHINAADCQVLIADNAGLLPLYEHSSVPTVMVALNGQVGAVPSLTRPLSGFICNQYNARLLMSRFVPPASILVAPYLSFAETPRSWPSAVASRQDQVAIGIGCERRSELRQFLDHIDVFRRYGSLQLRSFGIEILPTDMPIVHYAADQFESFMTGLFAYVTLPSMPHGPDPLIPDMLLAGIPVIAARALVEIMDLNYTKNLIVVDNYEQAARRVTELVAGGVMKPPSRLAGSANPPTIGGWQQEVETWIGTLHEK